MTASINSEIRLSSGEIIRLMWADMAKHAMQRINAFNDINNANGNENTTTAEAWLKLTAARFSENYMVGIDALDREDQLCGMIFFRQRNLEKDTGEIECLWANKACRSAALPQELVKCASELLSKQGVKKIEYPCSSANTGEQDFLLKSGWIAELEIQGTGLRIFSRNLQPIF
jgi:hypothetical protein